MRDPWTKSKKKLGRTVKKDLSIKSIQLGIAFVVNFLFNLLFSEIFRLWKYYSRYLKRRGDFILFIIG